MRVLIAALVLLALLLTTGPFVYASTYPEFIETFEGYTTGGTSLDSLDKNDSVGPNQAANGTGNPWWGSLAPNGRIDASRAHSGSKSLWGTAGGCKDLCNVQYRIGGGVPFAGNIYLDWWFYDPLGSGGSTTDFCGDYTALSFYSGIPSNTDFQDPVPYPLSDSIQQLALGMSDDLNSGYDPTKYQARVQGDAGGYHNGWFNGNLTRSVGWHHARIIVGLRKSPSNTNDVTFFIDNMASAIIGSRDSTTTTGYNIIEVNTIMPAAGTCSSAGGCVYSTLFHYSSVDDVNMSTLATPVTGAPSTGIGTSQITWNWIINALDGNGLTLWDSASAGSVKATLGTMATTFPETGLPANTSCSRFVESVTTRYCGVVDGYRSPLPPTYTLALPPVYGTSGDNAVKCGYGPGGNTVPLPAGLAATLFTAIRGFGSGPTKAGKYEYFWNMSADDPSDWSGASLWTSGTLSKTAYATGAYYLHLRACNADGLANPTSLTLGPYNYVVYTPVSKISDLWPLDNDLHYVLSPKTISALWSDGFWIEETDRHAGIKVVWNGTPKLPVNNSVKVYGLLSTGDERVLVADYVIYDSVGTPIKPVVMIGRDAGGKGLNASTPAVTGGKGIYSVGLLVRITGTAGDAGADFFYLDDGSGLMDGAIKGMKVMCGSLTPASSGSQVVTGVIGIVAGKPVLYAASIVAQ